ncbi:hypothetical protein [Porphyromonas gulae]|uniref:hypothetical protein n=1 Tax=Porphyromonas gulae TaxID=111105 RepID=UPI00051CE596|nr:hypothetical protein [Porphyromonas gulae]KGL49880.1 hypothetical protein HQ49_02015 [Porphyromonas gulae]
MYNYKDKAVHVRDLLRERFADTDREILRAVSPDHPESLCVRPASQRHEIVLHALLDIITREEVEKRREAILNPAPVDGDGDSESVEDPTPAPTHVDGEDNAEDVDNPAPAEDNSLLSEVADQANQLEGRVDELEGQISDLSDELNAEKKSEQKPQKNKRKKSTH